MIISLKTDGDDYEKHYYDNIIMKDFPSYELFWQRFVVPLTNRPNDIHFKTDHELSLIGKGHQDLCIAQLHYTVLRQLIRTYDLIHSSNFGIDHLALSLSTIVASQDCAFELLKRYLNPSNYDPWLSKKITKTQLGSREAQSEWKAKNGYPLQHIREYRNNFLHGRTLPGINSTVPKVGLESKYFDWRLVTGVASLPIHDFEKPSVLMVSFYNETLEYYEACWKKYLL